MRDSMKKTGGHVGLATDFTREQDRSATAAKRPLITASAVYFLRHPAFGIIKIGWAGGDLIDRVRSLQGQAGHRLELLAALPGGSDLETAYHCRFYEHSTEIGEWFYPAPPILAEIERIQSLYDSPPMPAPCSGLRIPYGNHPLAVWLRARGRTVQSIGQESRRTLSIGKALRGEQCAPATARFIERVTDGEITAAACLSWKPSGTPPRTRNSQAGRQLATRASA